MSSGGKLQLAFRGPQDAYISGRPQMTFFKAVYKRYTNFAKECVWCPFDGNPRQGGKSTATIERQGDLIQEAFITADIDNPSVTNLGSGGVTTASNNLAYAGERLIESVELYIGQQLIDKHYQRWWRVFSELYHDDAKKAQYSKMTSPDGAATKCRVYLPLIFFFNRNPGLALPLVSIPNQQVRLTFNWSPDEGVWATAPEVIDSSIKCWVNYIYLDDEERRVMSDRDQSYLIDQVQYSGGENINSTAEGAAVTPQRIPLNFKHPVKELYWCAPYILAGDITQRQWNYSIKSLGVTEVLDNTTAPSTEQTEPHLSGGIVRLGIGADTGVSETDDGTLQSLSIEINKSKVAEEQGGKYYNSIQPFQYHSGCPVPGIYSYSFATDPESIKPTGSCNFSRIQDAAAFVRFKTGTTTANPNMEIFATNFNVLDIKKGFASLAFSS